MGALAHLTRSPGLAGVATRRDEETPLDVLHRVLRDGAHQRIAPMLDQCHADATAVASLVGSDANAVALSSTRYVGRVVSELAANGELEAVDTRIAVDALADATGISRAVAAFTVFERVVSDPHLIQLPPAVAIDVQLRLLLHLDVVRGLVVWQLDNGELGELVALGEELPSARVRRAARAALRGGAPLSVVGAGGLRAYPIRRFGVPVGAIVAETRRDLAERAGVYLDVAAQALGPVLERELLLDRGAQREVVLTRALEKRLMRVGFDLHDGPIQDVLSLGGELRLLGHELYPFLLDTHRRLAAGRFDDLVARVEDIDAALREIAHMLESRTVTSRPLGETLHRLVDEFSHRTEIDCRLAIVGDPESLTAAQRIAVFRALQESLTNVREHSGASAVEVELRARRHSIEVQVTDNGAGFDVERALARAAQRGRLGLVGMGERVRMLGGTFDIDSRPGGPTTLRFALPRLAP